MMTEEIEKNRSVVTTVSLPFFLYLQLIEKAHRERTSMSEVVREALYQQFENKKGKDLIEK